MNILKIKHFCRPLPNINFRGPLLDRGPQFENYRIRTLNNYNHFINLLICLVLDLITYRHNAVANENAEIHLLSFTQKSLKRQKKPNICVLLLIYLHLTARLHY